MLRATLEATRVAARCCRFGCSSQLPAHLRIAFARAQPLSERCHLGRRVPFIVTRMACCSLWAAPRAQRCGRLGVHAAAACRERHVCRCRWVVVSACRSAHLHGDVAVVCGRCTRCADRHTAARPDRDGTGLVRRGVAWRGVRETAGFLTMQHAAYNAQRAARKRGTYRAQACTGQRAACSVHQAGSRNRGAG